MADHQDGYLVFYWTPASRGPRPVRWFAERADGAKFVLQCRKENLHVHVQAQVTTMIDDGKDQFSLPEDRREAINANINAFNRREESPT